MTSIPLSDNHMHIWSEIPLAETVAFFEDVVRQFNYKEITFCAINEHPNDTDSVFAAHTGKMQNLKAMYLKKNLSIPVFVYAGLHLTKGKEKSDAKDLLNQAKMYREAGYDGIKMFYSEGMYQSGYPHLSYKIYEPFFSFMEETQMPITIHIGGAEICYRDIEEIPEPQRKWHSKNPYIHFYDMLKDLDLMLEKFPKLKITLAHFGFLSEHIDWAEAILNKYENLRLDVCPSLFMYYDFQKNKKDWTEFFIKYADRIMFGTDTGSNVLDLEKKEPAALNHVVRGFFTETETIYEFDDEFSPMVLPEDVLRKLFRENMLEVNGGVPKEINLKALSPEIEFEEKYGEKTPLAIENLRLMKEDFGF